jgi:hypothetical protein
MGILLIEKCFVVCSSRQQSQQPATARVKARQVPVPGVEPWSPSGVQTRKNAPPWRPVASKSLRTKSFVSGGNPCKSLIFLTWHGRGREFESHQVHQYFLLLTLYSRLSRGVRRVQTAQLAFFSFPGSITPPHCRSPPASLPTPHAYPRPWWSSYSYAASLLSGGHVHAQLAQPSRQGMPK